LLSVVVHCGNQSHRGTRNCFEEEVRIAKGLCHSRDGSGMAYTIIDNCAISQNDTDRMLLVC